MSTASRYVISAVSLPLGRHGRVDQHQPIRRAEREGLDETVSTTVKAAAAIPSPSENVTIATIVNAGVRRSDRSESVDRRRGRS